MRTVTFPGGETVPALGQGTWRMGEDRAKRRAEVAALRTSIELGMTLIDTAEMYADGGRKGARASMPPSVPSGRAERLSPRSAGAYTCDPR